MTKLSRGSVAARGVAMAEAGAAPVVIYVAHFFYGAALLLPSLVLSSCLLAIAVWRLASSQARRDLDRLRPAWPLLGLFSAVLAVAGFTLTPWSPGAVAEIWAWTDGAQSSSINRSATIIEMVKLVGLAAPFLVGCVAGVWAESARGLYAVILGLGAVYAAVSLLAFLSSVSAQGSGARLGGGFESPNVAGALFGVLMILVVAWGVRLWTRLPERTLAEQVTAVTPIFALTVLFTVCLFLTASRAALGASLVALMLFGGWAVVDNRRVRGPVVCLLAAILCVAGVVCWRGNTLFADRIVDTADGAVTRIDLLKPHWDAFLDAPLFGFGLGSFPEVNNLIMTAETAEALSSTVVLHNVYLQWLEEAGLIGALPMFGLVGAIIGVTTWRTFRRSRNRTLLVGLLSASVIVLLHGGVDVGLNTPSFCALWSLLLGLAFGFSQASGPASRTTRVTARTRRDPPSPGSR